MMMIPRVYQPDTPAAERAGEGFAPPADAVAKMMKYNEELAKAGALISLDGLHPLANGARVHFAGGKAKVTDGPYIESKEVIGGFWMIQVKSKDEAVEWARRILDTAEAVRSSAFKMDGKMVDAPVIERARRIIERSNL